MFDIGVTIAAAAKIGALDLSGRNLYNSDFIGIQPQPTIIGLRLAFNNLSDPAIIDLFPNALQIDISNNEFESIPDRVYEIIIASHNKLTKLPRALFSVEADHNNIASASTNVKHLNISHNPLTSLDADCMIIDANHCKLTSIKPSNAKTVNLAFNRLQEFSQCWPKLKFLNISNNPLQEFSARLPKCTVLLASDCGLFEIPIIAPNVRQTDLSHNFLTDIPEWPLTVLNISDNYVQELANYDKLIFLDASHNDLRSIKKWPELRWLDLSYNLINGVQPDPPSSFSMEDLFMPSLFGDKPVSADTSDVFVFHEWPALRHLNLSNCKIGAAMFQDWPELRWLDISHNKLYKTAGFKSWPKLRELRMSHNALYDLSDLYGQVTEQQFEKTGMRHQLTYVDISHNRYSSPIPDFINVSNINVSHNKLDTCMIGSWVCGEKMQFIFDDDIAWSTTIYLPNWPRAKTINISYNNLNIRLPLWNALYIDVSHNSFYGGGDRNVNDTASVLPIWPKARVINLAYNSMFTVSMWPNLHYMVVHNNPIKLSPAERACCAGEPYKRATKSHMDLD